MCWIRGYASPDAAHSSFSPMSDPGRFLLRACLREAVLSSKYIVRRRSLVIDSNLLPKGEFRCISLLEKEARVHYIRGKVLGDVLSQATIPTGMETGQRCWVLAVGLSQHGERRRSKESAAGTSVAVKDRGKSQNS